MTEVFSIVFTPSAGTTIELPSEIGRKDCGHYGGGQRGDGTFKISVVGRGKKSEYVVLSNDVGHTEVEGDSEILGTDVADETLWYAVPISAYGGGE
ncbi:hypothetical protein [Haloarcula marismortui]|uniref:Uncharacterized protein n=1 Tax=Haloarcula marismortui (strain ATCC 43049 / DSM 3752 / JCM 8966 / VKM B-1809) TaxID=272569 RepID=A0A4P8JZ67_HALMA|nr:hypothetical protein [Haloarcula marismortui]QCP91434.1 hypothetical protein E6P14_11445 [Haloarcula marismortui ATCC 43049]